MTRVWSRQIPITGDGTFIIKALDTNPAYGKVIVNFVRIDRSAGSYRVAWRYPDPNNVGQFLFHDLIPTSTGAEFELSAPMIYGKHERIGDNDESNAADLVLIAAGGANLFLWAAGAIVPAQQG